jgi:hypothetical protein
MLLLLVALLQADPQRDLVDKGVTFPDKETLAAVAKKSEWHKKVCDILLDPALWAASLKTIEERTGIKAEKLEIKVTLGTIKEAPAVGHGTKGKGAVELDIDQLAKYAKGADEIRRLQLKGVAVVVPPAKTESVIPHELTHCFQGTMQPDWFLEGMACYVTADPNILLGFRAAGRKVAAVDEEMPREWTFARGWAFFEWMKAKHDVTKFIALAISGKTAADAAAEVTGLSWDDLKKAEAEWSATWVRKFK